MSEIDWSRVRRFAPEDEPGANLDRVRTIVVTGASRGIGEAVVAKVARPGVRLALVARGAEDLERVAARAREHGAEAHVLAVDLRDLDAGADAAHRILELVGVPDVVVSNAGHSIRRSVQATFGRAHDVARTASINYVGAVAFLLPLIEGMTARRRGQIIVNTSGSARTPLPGWSAYTASKAAMDAWCRAVRPELERQGVAVSVVELPAVRTQMNAPSYGSWLPFLWSPAKAADRIVELMATRAPLSSPFAVRLFAAATALAPVTTARFTGWVTAPPLPRGLARRRGRPETRSGARSGTRALRGEDRPELPADATADASPFPGDTSAGADRPAGPDRSSGSDEPTVP